MDRFFLAALGVSAIGAAWDLATGRIPNWLTYPALVLAIATHAAVGGASAAAWSVAGALACAALPLALFAAGVHGGGDLKLFAVVGALLHPLAGLEAQAWTFVAALVIAPLRVAAAGGLGKTLRNVGALVANVFRAADRRTEIAAAQMTWFRLGPCIFLGVAALHATR